MVLVLIIIVAVLVTLINFLDVKKFSTEKQLPIWIFPILLMFTVGIPVAVIILCMFALYRQCIGIILNIRHGERFIRLLNAKDTLHTINATLQNVINNVLIYQCPKTMSASEFYEALKEKLHQPYTLPKFKVIFKKQFGYSYMLKEKSIFNICFRKMEIINSDNHKLSKTEFMLLINKGANSHLPEDDRMPWEILVGSQPIQWADDQYNYYFALCRYHHSILDGEALMKLTVASYADKENTATTSEKTSNVIMKLCELYESFLAFILIPSWCVLNFVLKKRRKHTILDGKTSNQYHYAINIEDHSGYVQKIKRIKSKIPGASFSAVLFTAVSASLEEFCIK
ncbi:hypothetical protein ILUMI_18497, partial [Ignelater luminosus]